MSLIRFGNNMIDTTTISNIFFKFLEGKNDQTERHDRLLECIRANIETNSEMWSLEDRARMDEYGSEHVASTKKIDERNQHRNDLICKIDTEITNRLQVTPLTSVDRYYSETPGMIIDRFAILHIKLSVIQKLIIRIQEKELREDYREKEKEMGRQIESLGSFLDRYFHKLKKNEVYFEVQPPVKIYNDTRVRKYISSMYQKSQKG